MNQALTPKTTAQSKRSTASAKLAGKLAQIQKHLHINWPYRCSTSRWAGGNHSVAVQLAERPDGECRSERAWSGNGKWTGTNSVARLNITRRCIKTLGTQIVIGGLITLDVKVLEPRVYRAVWLEQSRGVSLKVVHGWIIKGHHSTAKTLEKAKKDVAKARTNQFLALKKNRSSLRDVDFTTLPLHQIMVTRGDSLNAGNCTPGTDSFIRTHFSDNKKTQTVSAATLLAVSDDVYVRRTILVAEARQIQFS